MKTHYICQNSMTGAIHVCMMDDPKDLPHWTGFNFTPCGFKLMNSEYMSNPNLTKKSKICQKCHKSLLKSHNKNLITYISHLKLTGKHIYTGENPNDRIKI